MDTVMTMLAIVAVLACSALVGNLVKKHQDRQASPAGHSDFHLYYAVPGSREQVLRQLGEPSYAAGMCATFRDDDNMLTLWKEGRSGRKSYTLELREKGEHCIVKLTLYSFVAGGRGVDTDAFFAEYLKAQKLSPQAGEKS